MADSTRHIEPLLPAAAVGGPADLGTLTASGVSSATLELTVPTAEVLWNVVMAPVMSPG